MAANSATITVNSYSTEYQVRVRATNDEGDSDWSEPGTGSTGTPPPSDDGTLSSLVLNRYPPSDPPQQLVALAPPFESGTTEYGTVAPVPSHVNLVTVVVTPNNLDATVAINPDRDDRIRREATIGLVTGENTITVKVTAEDGVTTQTYTVTVERDQYPPSLGGPETDLRFLPENTAPNTDIGPPIAATDRDGDTVTLTLEGDDANAFAFDISTGAGRSTVQIKTKAGVNYDYEAANRQLRYEFTVIADDGNGGTDTRPVEIRVTDVDEQVATPAAPSVSRSFLSLDVRWTRPDRNGGPSIRGYAVQYRQGTSGPWLDDTHQGHGRSTTIPDLLPATEYQVRVRALSHEIDSEWSEPGSGTTDSRGVQVSKDSLVIGEGSSATYTVVLVSDPTGPVTITPTVSGAADVSVSPLSLPFTAGNWHRSQTVTVSAAYDPGFRDDDAVISHQVTGAKYSGEPAADVRIVVEDADVGKGTIESRFTAVMGGPGEVPVWGGPLPYIHFGEPFQLAVGFYNSRGLYVVPDRGENYDTGGSQWLGPDRALRVTGAEVEFLQTASHRIRMKLTPQSREDVTVTVRPMNCPGERAICKGSNGLANRLHLRVRGVSGVPEAPGNVRVDKIDYNENGQPDLEVTFDVDPVGTHYTIQYQRAGLSWGSFEQETGSRGPKRSGRERDILFDVSIGQAYDVRVRWENANGAGPWTTVYNVGTPGGNTQGPPLVERIQRRGDNIWIFFTRDLDVRPSLNKSRARFEVHYSESRPRDPYRDSWIKAEYVNDVAGQACTSNDQKCRIVRLTLPPLERGGEPYSAPSDDETVSVSHRHLPNSRDQIRAVGEWSPLVPEAPEFTRVVAVLVGATPALSVADAEGREGSNPSILFAVTLAPTSTEEVAVRYTTHPLTATAGADYTHTSGRLTFAPGDWRKTVEVPIADDDVEDNGETFFFELSNASGADIEDNLATGTILNREDERSPLTASFENMPASHDTTSFTFGLVFSEEVALSYETLRDEAFEVTGGTVQAASRQQQDNNEAWDITVGASGGDVTITLPETTDCNASGAICTGDGRPLSHALSDTVAGPLIVPALSVSDASATEGDAVEFTVSLSAASSQQVTVEYATSGGTATSGTDFAAASGTMTFAANERSRTVSVATTDDTDDEGNETFTLTLSSPANATLGDGTATGTILDNDDNVVALTAAFDSVPASHTGEPFTFKLTFSEEFPLSYKTLRDEAFDVREGAIQGAKRQQKGSNMAWDITVEPASANDTVTITLPETTDCNASGAICKAARPLRGPVTASIPEAAPQVEEQQAADNNVATGAPAITGTPQVGETLTASTSGISDEDGTENAVFAHQWIAYDGTTDTDIQGANASTHTLTDADQGRTIQVRVSFTDDAGNDESLTSAATAAVAARPNSPATGAPAITGTAQVGETLTADTSDISDSDGMDDATFSFQWLADDADIAGATGSSYTLTDTDEDKAIKVRVSFTDDSGNEETLTSAATDAVAARPNSPATGAPTISGTAQVGETLTAGTSGISDTDGMENATFTFQWQAGDADISSATGSSYTLLDTDEGKAVKVQVSFTDDAGNDESVTSAATAAVEAAPPQNNTATGAPTTSGTVKVGHVLTADATGIDDQDGIDSAQFTYQWLADDTAITGATDATYLLTASEKEQTITVTVSFTDDEGNEEALTSLGTVGVTTNPLTVSVENEPDGHDGQSDFTFELRFSEQFGLSHLTLKNHAFTVVGGSVQKAKRLDRDSKTPLRFNVRCFAGR